ncbi:MAG: invasion associated locus B family protein [Rhodospirillaceae bacterium]|nr:invasion associated locus B family protein [Rhodospirillales bacterium]
MDKARIAFVAALAVVGAAQQALADEAKRLVSVGSWEAYAYTDAGSKVCYAAARADKSNDRDRAGTAIAITHRPKSPGEVSLIAPYGFKKDSDAEIQIGGMKHTFFTKGGSAWAKDGTADKAIITAMAKGKDLVVKATPSKGATISDTISLKGFGDALAAIDKACGVKR